LDSADPLVPARNLPPPPRRGLPSTSIDGGLSPMYHYLMALCCTALHCAAWFLYCIQCGKVYISAALKLLVPCHLYVTKSSFAMVQDSKTRIVLYFVRLRLVVRGFGEDLLHFYNSSTVSSFTRSWIVVQVVGCDAVVLLPMRPCAEFLTSLSHEHRSLATIRPMATIRPRGAAMKLQAPMVRCLRARRCSVHAPCTCHLTRL